MKRAATVADIPTPALILDLAALDRNIGRMAAFFSDGSCRLRPHFKAHKTPEIAMRQLAAGSCSGLTCATVSEAETVAAFCEDILIANEIVDAARCRRVADLAGRASVAVAADSEIGLAQMGAAASAAGSVVGVLIDVDVGQHRCGVTHGETARRLAQQASATPGLALRGVMGYEGHLQPIRERHDRDTRAREAMARLTDTAELLRRDGLACDVVSAGGTGTFDITGRVPGVTEVQAGSYALMDADYGQVGVPFEQAFWVLGTVISRPAADRCVADCGHKSATKDHGHPVVVGIAGASITSHNDEHAVIALPPGATVCIGDRLRLVPSHTDPTINLHDALYVLEGDRVVDKWLIAARGYPEHEGPGS